MYTSSDGLEEVLAQDPGRLRDRAATLFDRLVPSDQPLVLFGAGGLGRKTLIGLRKLGRPPVAFADSSSRLQGSQVDGIPVLSPEAMARDLGPTAAVIVSVFIGTEQVRRRAVGLGCATVLPFYPLFWKDPDLFLPHYAYDLPQNVIAAALSVRGAWELLADDESRREFLGQLRWRIDPESAATPPPCRDEIYFPPDLVSLSPREVFVDCGGYDGDTARSFLRRTENHFRRLLVLEPDPFNFQKLSTWMASLPESVAERVEARPLAVDRRAGTVHFDVQGAASSSVSESGGVEVHCETLDTLLEGEAATFIKMDIEGAELEALEGAAGQIRAHRPTLAISAYHRQGHLWQVPMAIHALCPEYDFYLRRHSPEILDELVLYAIPQRQ